MNPRLWRKFRSVAKTSVSRLLMTTRSYPQAEVSLACRKILVSASSVVLIKWERSRDADDHTILISLKPPLSINSQSEGSSEQFINSFDMKDANSDLLDEWLINWDQL